MNAVLLDLDDAHRAVPRSGDADGELVAGAQLALLAAQLLEAPERLGAARFGPLAEDPHELARAQLGLPHASDVAAVHERAVAVLDALHVARRRPAGSGGGSSSGIEPADLARCIGVVRHR